MVNRGTIMAFGVFDRLHPGHRYFLRRARRFGKRLAVVVARDSAALRLKKKKPLQGERARLRAVRKIKEVDYAALGDRASGSYAIVKKISPHAVCFGYDQNSLRKDLSGKIKKGLLPKIKFFRVKAHRPRKYHSSVIPVKN